MPLSDPQTENLTTRRNPRSRWHSERPFTGYTKGWACVPIEDAVQTEASLTAQLEQERAKVAALVEALRRFKKAATIEEFQSADLELWAVAMDPAITSLLHDLSQAASDHDAREQAKGAAAASRFHDEWVHAAISYLRHSKACERDMRGLNHECVCGLAALLSEPETR